MHLNAMSLFMITCLTWRSSAFFTAARSVNACLKPTWPSAQVLNLGRETRKSPIAVDRTAATLMLCCSSIFAM
jgi:hypothetical protein